MIVVPLWIYNYVTETKSISCFRYFSIPDTLSTCCLSFSFVKKFFATCILQISSTLGILLTNISSTYEDNVAVLSFL